MHLYTRIINIALSPFFQFYLILLTVNVFVIIFFSIEFKRMKLRLCVSLSEKAHVISKSKPSLKNLIHTMALSLFQSFPVPCDLTLQSYFFIGLHAENCKSHIDDIEPLQQCFLVILDDISNSVSNPRPLKSQWEIASYFEVEDGQISPVIGLGVQGQVQFQEQGYDH